MTRGLIRAIEFDSRHAVVVSDNTVGIWCLETELHLRTLQGDTVTCISSLNGSLLVTGSIDRSVKLWDVTTGKCLKAMEECGAEVRVKTGLVGSADRQGKVKLTVDFHTHTYTLTFGGFVFDTGDLLGDGLEA